MPDREASIPGVGPFTLLHTLGAGATGAVWRAVHAPTGRPAAVKVISRRGPSVLAGFRTEVRAAASLSHPHIIALYDHGVLGAEAAAASRGRIAEGTPWLAMELARGGDLQPWCGALSLTELLGLLRALLDALGHAHARRVVHRDLKPQNVVLRRVRSGILLTDFGLADLDTEAGPSGGGTPGYMAPEQLTHSWRDFGPWTDLYALGCLTWALWTGRPPFPHSLDPGRSPDELPPLPGGAPEGLDAWCRSLLDPDPARRPRTAADAARGLSSVVSTGAGPTLARPALDVPTARGMPTLDWFVGEGGLAPAPSARAPSAGRVPLDWRAAEDAPRGPGLRGAGLSLLRYRRLPVVGREDERDALWGGLREAVRQGRPRCVVLRGRAGTGKSRLAEWLCVRSHEVGATTTLRATHSPEGGASDGLVAMLRRHLRCGGLHGRALRSRVIAALPGADAHLALGLATLLDPAAPAPPDRAERHELLTRLLERLGRASAVACWLDDVHWSPESLDWARHLLAVRRACPALLLVTVQEEALATRPRAVEALTRLLEVSGVVEVEVGPLARQPELVHRLMGLEEGLAGHVLERTGGNPLFAVQLVEDWVERDLLVPGPSGFGLRGEDTLPVPPSLHTVWIARVERLLAALPAGAGEALERAAVLGLVVDPGEWREACAEDGLSTHGLSEAVLANQLGVADPEDDTWRFVHGLLRDSVLRRASEAGRLREHHEACAAMLQRQAGAEAAARLGVHLFEAGHWGRCLEPLLDGVELRLRSGENARAAALLDSWQRAVAAAGVPRGDPRRCRGSMLRAENATFLDTGASEAVAGFLAEARAGGQRRYEALALRLRAVLHLDAGRLAEAEADLDRALELAGDDAEAAIAVRTVASTVARNRGALAHADALLDGAEALLSETDGRHAGNIWVQRGLLSVAMQQPERAKEAFTWALAAYRARGVRRGVAQSLNGLAEAQRAAGALDDARTTYRQALEVYEHLGSGEAAWVRVNLAMVELLAGDFARAIRIADPAREEIGALAENWLTVVIDSLLGAAAAGLGDWRTATDHLADARARQATIGLVDGDLRALYALTADRARAAGADEALELAEALLATQGPPA